MLFMNKTNGINKHSIIMTVLSVVFIVAFFVIPYHFPTSKLVLSMSYDYGFNNKLGLILVLFGIFTFGLFGFFREKRNDIKLFNTNIGGIKRLDYFICLVVLALYVLIIGITNGDKLICYGGECTYFLPHIEDMMAGKVPYKDFIFYYGPAFIYVPYWLHCLLPELSVVFAYLLTLFIFESIGLYCLYEVICHFKLESKYKRFIFYIVFLASFPIALGLNYELLRFVPPFWLLLRLPKTKRSLSFILYPLSVITCLSISPEVGLSFMIAIGIYLSLNIVFFKEKHYLFLLLFTIIASFSFMIFYHDMFSMLTSSASGLLNFPFIISLHLIAFFVSLFIIGYNFGIKIRTLKNNILECSFIIMSIGLIPACLGRCDPGHVTYFGLFVFILCFVFISYNKKFVWLSILIGIVITAFIQFWNVRSYSSYYVNNYRVNNNNIDITIDHSILNLCDGDITMPLINRGDMLDIYTKLVKDNKYVGLYITRMSYSATPENVFRTINEIDNKNIKYLLFSKDWEEIVEPRNNAWVFKNLFYSFSTRTPIRNSNIVYQPLLDYVRDNYSIYNSDNNYVIYLRNTYN